MPMTFKDQELKEAKVTRTVIRDANVVLDKLSAPQRALEDLMLEYADLETVKKLTEQGESGVADYLGKDKELARKIFEIQRSQSVDLEVDLTYELFTVAVDKTGWSDEDKAEFASVGNLDNYSYEEVKSFVDSFRSKLPKRTLGS